MAWSFSHLFRSSDSDAIHPSLRSGGTSPTFPGPSSYHFAERRSFLECENGGVNVTYVRATVPSDFPGFLESVSDGREKCDVAFVNFGLHSIHHSSLRYDGDVHGIDSVSDVHVAELRNVLEKWSQRERSRTLPLIWIGTHATCVDSRTSVIYTARDAEYLNNVTRNVLFSTKGLRCFTCLEGCSSLWNPCSIDLGNDKGGRKRYLSRRIII